MTLPDRDRAWLEEIQGYACCVCDTRRGVQAHHVRDIGAGSMGKKPPDWMVVPLCAVHHDALHRARLTSEEMVKVYRTAALLMVRYLAREKSVEVALGEEGF